MDAGKIAGPFFASQQPFCQREEMLDFAMAMAKRIHRSLPGGSVPRNRDFLNDPIQVRPQAED